MSQQSSRRRAVFTEGSTMRHVIIMTSTSAIGLMSVFFVDAISLFYISQLNDFAQTAAVGRAGYVLAFIIGITIGMMIGVSVLVSRAIGADRYEAARSYAGSAVIGVLLINGLIAAAMMLARDPLLRLLNAEGEALAYAQIYLTIILPSMPFFGVGVVAMGVLRAKGDARRAMTITLAGGILTAILDPIFIFWFGFEVVGAAMVSSGVRAGFAALGLYYMIGVHDMIRWPSVSRFFSDMRDLATISLPAILTNIAAPVGAFLIAQKVAEYGDDALAGQSVVDRLIPLAFGVIFALSGAVGPIIGQNAGAGMMGRVRQTLLDGIKFNVIYVLFAWGLLYLGRNAIIDVYSATGDMALMIDLFATIVAASFMFNGLLFVTNATFNNLGKPIWATGFNWLRQTVGVIPFIALGASWGELRGIAWGVLAGSVPFALLALVVAFYLINAQTRAADQSQKQPKPEVNPAVG